MSKYSLEDIYSLIKHKVAGVIGKKSCSICFFFPVGKKSIRKVFGFIADSLEKSHKPRMLLGILSVC